MSRIIHAVATAGALATLAANPGDLAVVQPEPEPGADPLPDRLAIDPKSPHHNAAALARGVGVRFKGVEIFNCAEYSVSEGWVRRIPAGRTYRQAVKLQGVVEPFWRT